MNDQISMMYSAWGIYFEENQDFLQPKKPPIPLGLVLFSERDKCVKIYHLNFPEKYKLFADFTFKKIQNWINNKIIPIKFDEKENRFFVSSNEDGTHFDPWTEEFWEQAGKLLNHNIRIKKFQ